MKLLITIMVITIIGCVRLDLTGSQRVQAYDDTDPIHHRIYSASSVDGINFTPDGLPLLESASVPSAVVTKSGAIRLYYVDGRKKTTACAESTDGGKSFKALEMTISAMTGVSALDPSIVLLKDGRYRLYYFVETSPNTSPEGVYSAVSSDGLNFTEEGRAFSYPNLVDADVFKMKKEWMMISIRNDGGDRAVISRSRDGVSFEYVQELDLQGYRPSTPVAFLPFKRGGKQFRMYALNTKTGNIESFTSTNGLEWALEPGIRLAKGATERLSDPCVVRLPDGTWKMFYRMVGVQTGTQKHYMALHACDTARTDCSNPRNHQVYLAESQDGYQWSLVKGWIPYAGSVPDVIRRGTQLYVYSLPPTLVRYNLATSTQSTPTTFTVSGTSSGGIVDPSLTLDEKGRFILFYMEGQIGGDPASCLQGQTSCTKIFKSATEVEGSDGTSFTVDRGSRATVLLSSTGTPRAASDPDIFSNNNGYVMYISHGANTSVWTANELRGSFKKLQDLSIGTGGVASGYYNEATGEYMTYAHINRNGVAVIRVARHNSLLHQLVESDWTTVVTGTSLGLTSSHSVESPGID